MGRISQMLWAALPAAAALFILGLLFFWWTLGFRAFTSYSHVVELAKPLPKVPPALTFLDQNHQIARLDQLRGQYWLVNFVYLGCTSTCPASMASFQVLHRSLPQIGGKSIGLLTLTLHPWFDSPESMRRAWENWGSPSYWQLAAPQVKDQETYWEDLRKMGMWVDWDAQGFPVHDDRSFLINPEGLVVESFAGVPKLETLQQFLQKAP